MHKIPFNRILNSLNSQNLTPVLKKVLSLLPHIGVAVAIFIYSLIQIQNFTPAYQEVDPDGYLFLAKRIARFQYPAVDGSDFFKYQNHVWVETTDGKVMPKFDPGYPLIMSFFYKIGGDEAMFWVSPLMGGLGLLGAYLLFRLWMSSLAAALGVWILAINPMYCIYSGYLLTHATNSCIIIWGMYFLWKWLRGNAISGIGAGLLLGFVLTVRHSSTLLVSVVLISIVIRWFQTDGTKKFSLNNPTVKEIGILLLCYSIFPILLGIYNWKFFGNPLVTGYGLTHEQEGFSLVFFKRNLRLMINGLNGDALFLIFPIGLTGIVLAGNLRERLLRVFWFFPIVILYTSYYWAFSGMAYLRFTICTFPVVIGSALLLMEKASERKSEYSKKIYDILHIWSCRIAMIGFVALLVFLRYGQVKGGMRGTVSDTGSRAVAKGARMLSKTLESDAVIFSQSPFFCYIGTRENFRHYDLARFNSLFNSPERRHPKRTEKLTKFFESLDAEDKIRKKRERVYEFISQGRQVVFFIPQDALEREKQQLGDNFRFKLIKEWQLPIKSPPPKWGIYQVEMLELDG